jgi:hypothetical protein
MANFSYSRTCNERGLNVEVVIRDESMSKIESFKCKADDFHKIAHILYKKYGIRYKPEIDGFFNKPKDLQWADKK